MTKKELEAENERLGAEVAALRALLTAVRDHADVPKPADYDNHAYRWLCIDRLGDIAIWAELNEYATGPNADRHLSGWAARLRERAARPLSYMVRAAEPAPTGMQSPAPVVRVVGTAHMCECGHYEAYHVGAVKGDEHPGQCTSCDTCDTYAAAS